MGGLRDVAPAGLWPQRRLVSFDPLVKTVTCTVICVDCQDSGSSVQSDVVQLKEVGKEGNEPERQSHRTEINFDQNTLRTIIVHHLKLTISYRQASPDPGSPSPSTQSNINTRLETCQSRHRDAPCICGQGHEYPVRAVCAGSCLAKWLQASSNLISCSSTR